MTDQTHALLIPAFQAMGLFARQENHAAGADRRRLRARPQQPVTGQYGDNFFVSMKMLRRFRLRDDTDKLGDLPCAHLGIDQDLVEPVAGCLAFLFIHQYNTLRIAVVEFLRHLFQPFAFFALWANRQQ